MASFFWDLSNLHWILDGTAAGTAAAADRAERQKKLLLPCHHVDIYLFLEFGLLFLFFFLRFRKEGNEGNRPVPSIPRWCVFV